MKIFYKYYLILLLSLSSGLTFAQSASLTRSVERFKKQDSISPPPKNLILFVGSSSFTNWQDVNTYFPNKNILNRGFGGSKLTDMIYYIDDIIFAYQPKQIVIYCGENDLGASDTVSAETVYQHFTKLYQMIRQRYKKATITYISMKPSPSRKHLMDKMVTANDRISKFLLGQKRTSYIDIYQAMLDEQGKIREDIFLSDQLHMNAKGYAIWQKIMAPYLL